MWRRICVALSLALNLAALFAVALVVRDRGGFTYLKAVLLRDASAHANPSSKIVTEIFKLSTVTAESRPIVFLGDSLTAGGMWNETLQTDAPVLNRGIGGETSSEILRRVPQVAALKPAAVFLMAGANDSYFLKTSPRETADIIGQIVARLRSESPDTVVYVQALLPSEVSSFVRWGERVNDLLAKLPDGHSVFFLNFRDDFIQNGVIAPRLTYDGLHLTAAGYDVWRRAIAPAVADASRRRHLLMARAEGQPTTHGGAGESDK